MNYSINIKSRTCGHYDYDNCDLCLSKVEDADFIPRIGDTLVLPHRIEGRTKRERYLVNNVEIAIYEYGTFYTVYVIKIS